MNRKSHLRRRKPELRSEFRASQFIQPLSVFASKRLLRAGPEGASLVCSFMREEPEPEFEGPDMRSARAVSEREEQEPAAPPQSLGELQERMDSLAFSEQLSLAREALERGERVPTQVLEGLLLLRSAALLQGDEMEQERGEKLLLAVFGKRASPKLLELEARAVGAEAALVPVPDSGWGEAPVVPGR